MHSLIYCLLIQLQLNLFDMLRIILVLSLVLLGLCEETKKQNRFPHKLWLYWHDPNFANAPVFVQLCFNNIRHFATVSGWQLILVNNETIYQYISQESNKKVASMKQRLPVVLKTVNMQYLPDIYRMFLLHDNGGMWIDISTIFLRDFQWVQNLQESTIVDNHIAKKSQVIMYTFDTDFGGNKTIIFDENSQKDVYLFPGLQVWCMIAKPRTKFFSDMIESIEYMLSQQSFESYILDRKKQGFSYINEADRYFAFSNLQMQTIMQKKQRQIDSNPDKFEIKYAFEYYGIWSIDSINSGFCLFHYFGWRQRPIIHKLFYQPLSSFPEKVKKDAFIKFSGYKRKDAIQFFDNAQAMDCSIKDGAFNKNSFISEYLLKYSEDMPFVKKIRSLEARPKGWSKSECRSPHVSSAIDNVGKGMMTFFGAIIFVAICLIAGLCNLLAAADERITKMCQAKGQSH